MIPLALRLFLRLATIVFMAALVWPELARAQSLSSPATAATAQQHDFLLNPTPFRTEIRRSPDGELELSNRLIRRTWITQNHFACISFDNLMNGQSMLRGIRPEARITVDGQEFVIGGLTGQPDKAYLDKSWIAKMQPFPNAFQLSGTSESAVTERVKWKQRRHCAPNVHWPPKGKHIEFIFTPTQKIQTKYPASRQLSVSIHYEMYDGLPCLTKWMTVHNGSEQSVTLERFRAEELAAVEHTNWVETRGSVPFPKPEYLHVETDFAFGGMSTRNANRHTVRWQTDPDYKSQVNYARKTPCLLSVEPTYGPAQTILPDQTFTSFRVFELVYDNADRERRGLTLRHMYRMLAPWVTENPITHHLLSSDPDTVRQAIDNAAEVGFEAIILSFGSGFNMERTDAKFLAQWTEVAKYAKTKKIELGAYSLFSSRSIGGGNDVVSPEGQSPAFGRAPAATSEWGIAYYEKLKRFFDQTGFDQFENDGPYPGDVDTTARPPLQKGEQDSRWAQWKIVTGLYRHLRANGVYINQPDFYFLVGGNKTGMGYREVNWSLPRAQQAIHTRQNIYDGTWEKTPSMGWMHVPLTQYHGGGAAATIEPLDEHLDHYERMMLSNLAMGVQAHYRGPRLFDTQRTKVKVAETVAWFKKHRDILESDFIHGRRADGRDVDWILHVNPQLKNPGMLCVFNPLGEEVTRKLSVDIYYTGRENEITFSDAVGKTQICKVDNRHRIQIKATVPANGMSWYLIEP